MEELQAALTAATDTLKLVKPITKIQPAVVQSVLYPPLFTSTCRTKSTAGTNSGAPSHNASPKPTRDISREEKRKEEKETHAQVVADGIYSSSPVVNRHLKQRLKVLVVDYESSVRQAIKLLLKHGGHSVEAVNNGKDALGMLAQRPFNLVITDFSIPDIRGDDLVVRIRQRWPAPRIIMATAFVPEYQVFGRSEPSVDALLFKPFSLNDLYDTIAPLFEQEEPDTASPVQSDVDESSAGRYSAAISG